MSKNSFQLSEKDIYILMALYRFGLMTVEHLIWLTGRYQQNLNERLLKLKERQYVCRRRNNPFEEYVYAVGPKSAPNLTSLGLGDNRLINLQIRRLRELKPLFIPHALLVTKIHLILELACEASSTKNLREWREGRQLYDSATIRNRIKPLPVRPDAFFSLDYGTSESAERRYFFLEADRGTTTNITFQKKIQAYSAYYKQSLFMKKYDVPTRAFRVITITESEERAENLCKASKEILQKDTNNFYYFTPISNFSLDEPASIFQKVFTSPLDWKTKKRYSLIPPLATSKPNQ